MSIHIIIDGYNLIRQSYLLSDIDQIDIQRGREALIERLAEYKRIKKHKITVVFDGFGSPPFSTYRNTSKGIEIQFSRSGESADAVIKRMADRLKERALVVSSDRDIVDYAGSKGAATINSNEFERVIMSSDQNNGSHDEIQDDMGWVPTTKKKGPSRRLSKSERRSRVKIQKL